MGLTDGADNGLLVPILVKETVPYITARTPTARARIMEGKCADSKGESNDKLGALGKSNDGKKQIRQRIAYRQ
jgi:hypothetical protein